MVKKSRSNADKSDKLTKKSNTKLSYIQRLGLFFYDRKLTTTLLWLGVLGFAAISYAVLLTREGFPSVNVPIGYVVSVNIGSTPELNDELIARPLIAAAKESPNIKLIDSSSTAQSSAVTFTFKDDTDVQAELDTIQKKVETKLPSTAQSKYVKVNAAKITNEGDDILISVYSPTATAESLDKSAARLKEILDKSDSSLISASRVVPLVEKRVDSTTGEQVKSQLRFDRYFDASTNSPELASMVAVRGVVEVDQLKLFDEVSKSIEKYNSESSEGTRAAISVDFAERIQEQVSGLQKNLGEGLLVVLVISFLLISLRASLVTATAMFTTVAATVGVLYLGGFTLNTITFFALILGLALIVDDTTIIVEAIESGHPNKNNLREVIKASLKKVARASTTGTITTMLTFSPMLFASGVLGKFIRDIPLTIIISLAISLLLSIVLIPLLTYYAYRYLGYKHRSTVFSRIEKSVSDRLASTVVWSSKRRLRSIAMRLTAIAISLTFLFVGLIYVKKAQFNIFPSGKDGNEIVLNVGYPDGLDDLVLAEKTADDVLSKTRASLGSNLSRISLSAQGGGADNRGFVASIVLTDMGKRDAKAPELSDKLESDLQKDFPALRIDSGASGVGPPVGSFAAEIKADNFVAASKLAEDVKLFLSRTELVRPDGSKVKLTDARVTPVQSVIRRDEQRIINASAGFGRETDTTLLVTLAQDAIKKEFNQEKLASYGLKSGDLGFNLGQEEDSQESIKSMFAAMPWLFLAIFALMAFQFRSFLQPLLIFTALPFSFFGIALGLYFTNNPFSFFVMIGFLAMLGISLNNTILLTDFANQATAEGHSRAESMAMSIRARFRPLITTSLTSVVALLPLALADPFWESLAYTLIFGLLSSTFLVLLVFPYFYMISGSIGDRLASLGKRVIEAARA